MAGKAMGKSAPKKSMATTTQKAVEEPQMMGSLFSSGLADQILAIDVMSMTPIEAMNALYKLQEEARKESGR